MHKWGLALSSNCECGTSEQTADHVLTACPIHQAPYGAQGLTVLDDETQCWLNNTTARSDSGSAAVWGSKRINPRPQSCLCLTWSGCPLNNDDDATCITWQTIHSLTSNHLPLLTVSMQHKTKRTCFHFTKTITNYQKADWTSLNNMLRILSSTNPTAQMFMRQINTLSRQFWMPTDSSSPKKITATQIILTYSCVSTSLSITINIDAKKKIRSINYYF